MMSRIVRAATLFGFLGMSAGAGAESYVSLPRVLASLKTHEALEYLVPCEMAESESVCAVVRGGLEHPDEFRIYTAQQEEPNSIQTAFSFVPGKYGAQNFLGSVSRTGTLETRWSPVGANPRGPDIVVIVNRKKGQYEVKTPKSKKR